MKPSKTEESQQIKHFDLLQLAEEMEKLGGGINVLQERPSLLCFLGNTNRSLNFKIIGNNRLLLSPETPQEKEFGFDEIFQEEEEIFNFLVKQEGESGQSASSLLTYFQRGFNVSLMSHSSALTINADDLLHIELLLFCIFENSLKEETKFCLSLCEIECDVENSAEAYCDLLMGSAMLAYKENNMLLSFLQRPEGKQPLDHPVDRYRDLEIILEESKKLIEAVELQKRVVLLRLGVLNKKKDAILNCLRLLIINEQFFLETKPSKGPGPEPSREALRQNEWRQKCAKEFSILLAEALKHKLVSRDKLELVLHKKTKFAKMLTDCFLCNTKLYVMTDLSTLSDLNKVHSLLGFQQRFAEFSIFCAKGGAGQAYEGAREKPKLVPFSLYFKELESRLEDFSEKPALREISNHLNQPQSPNKKESGKKPLRPSPSPLRVKENKGSAEKVELREGNVKAREEKKKVEKPPKPQKTGILSELKGEIGYFMERLNVVPHERDSEARSLNKQQEHEKSGKKEKRLNRTLDDRMLQKRLEYDDRKFSRKTHKYNILEEPIEDEERTMPHLFRQEMEDGRKRVKEMEKINDKLRERILEKEMEISRINAEHEKEIFEYEQTVKNLEKRFSTLTKTCDFLPVIEVYEKDIIKLEVQAQNLRKEISFLCSVSEEPTGKEAKWKQTLNAVNLDLAEKEALLNRFKKEKRKQVENGSIKDQQSKEIQSKSKELASLRKKLREQQEQLDHLSADYETLLIQNKELTKNLDEISIEKNNLFNQISYLKALSGEKLLAENEETKKKESAGLTARGSHHENSKKNDSQLRTFREYLLKIKNQQKQGPQFCLENYLDLIEGEYIQALQSSELSKKREKHYIDFLTGLQEGLERSFGKGTPVVKETNKSIRKFLLEQLDV